MYSLKLVCQHACSKFLPVALLLTVGLLSQATIADWQIPPNENKQNIVIVVSEDPLSNAERTCLAVTLASNLSGTANITLFATLDGVALGVESIVDSRRFKCPQADGSEISLQENLEAFLSGDPNNLVI